MWITEKFSSEVHRIRSHAYRKSPQWAAHPLNPGNKELLRDQWREIDRQLQEMSSKLDFELQDYPISAEDYFSFKKRCNVSWLYAMGYQDKKVLEHFISFKLLNLQAGDVYIDVASELSPFPEIFRKMFGVDAFSQDLTYKAGVHSRKIGSSADSIPLPNESVDKVSLQCAFEHFEGEIDARFIGELGRLLKPGGRCVIVPLYLSLTHQNIVDPLSNYRRIEFDDGATVIAEINLGGDFERVYSPAALSRILRKNAGLKFNIYRITGVEKLTADTGSAVFRVRYVLLITKMGVPTSQSREQVSN